MWEFGNLGNKGLRFRGQGLDCMAGRYGDLVSVGLMMIVGESGSGTWVVLVTVDECPVSHSDLV